MNFSDYTLVAFGDSFTFGDGLYAWDKEKELAQDYRLKCNKRAYVAKLQKRLRFKSSLNLAVMGCSLSRMYYNMQRFIEYNDTSEIFFVIGLPFPERQFTISRYTSKDNSITQNLPMDYWYGNINFDKRNFGMMSDTANLNSKWWDHYYAYFINKQIIVYEHINLMKAILKLLQGKKYLIFDSTNDLPYRLHNKKFIKELDIFDNYPLEGQTNGYNYPTFQTIIEDYKLMISENKNYINFLNNGFQVDSHPNRTVKHMDEYVKTYSEMERRAKHIPDGHWNEDGHRLVSHFLEQQIRKEFKND